MIEALKIVWRLMEVILGIVVVVTMICSLVAWIRGRCRFPRAVQWLALAALVTGGVVGLVLARADGLSGKAVLLWIILPPIWVYVAFVFLGGPLISNNERDHRCRSRLKALGNGRWLSCLLLVLVCSCTSEPERDAGKVLDDARRLGDAGKFQEALEAHIWFHDHALEVDQSYYGVRLSFALAEWVNLGRRYPPALDKLKEISNQKTARLLAGADDRALFHDVKAINNHLAESSATVELFKQLDLARPDFAASLYDLAEEALVVAGEFALARKHLGDPLVRLEITRRRFERGMVFTASSTNREASRKAFESNFAESVIRIIAILDKTSARVQAREIQTKALAVLESQAIKSALEE